MYGQPELHWSPAEKKVARKAYEAAYERECRAIGSKLRQMMADDSEPRYLWRIHDYLSDRRRETDRKYDYRYSVLIEVFARLLNEAWLLEGDLSGLSADKIEKIKGLANFFSGRTGLGSAELFWNSAGLTLIQRKAAALQNRAALPALVV